MTERQTGYFFAIFDSALAVLYAEAVLIICYGWPVETWKGLISL